MMFQSLEHVFQAHPLVILNGRGGRNQHDWFYQEMLNEARRLQIRYITLRRNAEKRLVQLELIGYVEGRSGVFMRRNTNGTFQEMTHQEKLKKVSQILRERPRRLNIRTAIAQAPPVPPDIGGSVRLDTDSIVSDDDNNEETSTGNVIIHPHPTNTQPPTHPDLESLPEPVNLMMEDDFSYSALSSIIELDNFTLNTFPLSIYRDDDNDGNGSLSSLHSHPLDMAVYDDDNDNVSLLSMEEV